MSTIQARPRLLIAGISGGSGKTIVSMGLLLLLRRAGVEVRAFKKGPDYIDPSWLSWAAANPARNLDTLLMGVSGVHSSFASNSIADGVNLIEGNRGLFDGFDTAGTHSSAALADALSTPIVLVLDATKMTRTAAAVVLGCQHLDPRISIRGVVLNNVNGKRHKQIVRAAIESACSIPVIGALPRVAVNPLPERHLGLVPPSEHRGTELIEQALLEMMEHNLDLDALLTMARDAPPIEISSPQQPQLPDAHGLKIGYLKDSAFSFYYPENLEELQRAGADLVPVSPLQQTALPQGLNALYIGGGFPETHAHELTENTCFLASLRQASVSGLPIFAECGGLMLLARSLYWKGRRHAMANVFPFDLEMCDTPQGHGYSELQVDSLNPFFPAGTVLHGHEFHYSRIVGIEKPLQTACAVVRGTGCFSGRDSVVYRNTMASYTHLHALATREWAAGFLTAACNFALLSQPS